MSAYVEDKAHIDALVRFACGGRANHEGIYAAPLSRYLDPGDADWLGRTLWRENAISVTYLYGEDDRGLPGPIGFTMADADSYTFTREAWQRPALPAVDILKACDGLEYQSCEHPEWATSDAKRLLDAIRDVAIGQLPGYDEAAWEITTPDYGSLEQEPAR